jgi:putative membrane protein
MDLWQPAFVLYLHVLSFMLTYAAVAAEYALLRSTPDAEAIRSLGRADAVYGLSAAVVFATGVLQVLYFGKGLDYYLQSGVLWSKVGLFTLVGAASVYPTVTFLRWQSAVEEVPANSFPADAPDWGSVPTDLVSEAEPSADALRRLRRVILVELGLLTALPLLGSLLRYGLP